MKSKDVVVLFIKWIAGCYFVSVNLDIQCAPYSVEYFVLVFMTAQHFAALIAFLFHHLDLTHPKCQKRIKSFL